MSVNNTQRALLANYLLGQGSSSTQGKNYVKNSIAINGTDNVTASGVGSSVTKNTTTPLTGISDFSIALGNNTTGYIEWSLDSLDRSLTNQNCQLTFDYKITSIGSVVQGQVYVGGVLSVSQTIPATPTTSTFSINVPCGDLSGATTVRISNATGNSGASVLNVANVNYGKATNIGTVAQAQLVGTVVISGCSTFWSGTSTTYTDFATQTGCTYATSGQALAPATNIPAIRFATLAPGDYRIEYEGDTGSITPTFASYFKFNDGTNSARETSMVENNTTTAAIFSPGISQSISYSAPQNNVTLKLQYKVDSGGTARVYGITTKPGTIKLWYFPTQSQLAVSSAQTDYDWTSFTPTYSASFGTVTGSSCYKKRRGPDLLVKCTGITGTVTAAIGSIDIPDSLVLDTTKNPSLSGSLGNSAVGLFYQDGAANRNAAIVTLPATSTTKVYIGPRSSDTAILAPQNMNNFYGSSEEFSLNFTIPIVGWSENQRAPTLIGSVTSNASGAERIERATFSNNGSVCSITSQSGSWITSVTRNGTGRCDVVYPSGTFSSAPTCTTTSLDTGSRYVSTNTPTTTGVSLFHINTSALADGSMSLICMGAR